MVRWWVLVHCGRWELGEGGRSGHGRKNVGDFCHTTRNRGGHFKLLLRSRRQGQNRVSTQWLEIHCKAITVHSTLGRRSGHGRKNGGDFGDTTRNRELLLRSRRQGQNRVSTQWLEIHCKAITVHSTLYLVYT
jgi:hypothetical protein